MKGILYSCDSELPYNFRLDYQNKNESKSNTRINACISAFGMISLKFDTGDSYLSRKFKIY